MVQHVLPRSIQHNLPTVVAVQQTLLGQRDRLLGGKVQAVCVLELGG